MSFLNSMNISSSALTAQSLRMDIISQNIANIDTTIDTKGNPYKRKQVIFQEINENKNFSKYFKDSINKIGSKNGGVRVSNIIEDKALGAKVYDPSHPNASPEGYISKSNVNIVKEMVDMISASRSYESSLTSINTTKSMISKTLEIGR